MSTISNKTKHIKLAQCKHVHFIGIGGIGISALARMMHSRGVTVSGINDSESKETLDGLRELGVEIDTLTAGVPSLPEGADIFVYSVAWEGRAPEVLEAARATGKRVLTYFEALGEIAQEYTVIAVSGTHGKTTTTAMTAQALIAAGVDPTVIVGSLVNFNDDQSARSHLALRREERPLTPARTNFRAGKTKYLLVEACEYKRHFLHFNPHILAVTNIELDHVDYYKDIADIEDAFAELASQSTIVLAEDSIQNNMLRVPELKVIGEHNRQNAALALAIVDEVVSETQQDYIKLRSLAKQAVADFAGTWRRFEYLGKTGTGAEVYDDYAHHPTAIKMTLAGAREEFRDKKIVVVFEPHMYSRTQKLMGEFAESFSEADEVIIAPIYAAREEAIEGVTAETLAQNITKAKQNNNKNAQSADTLEQAGILTESLTQEGDVIIFMGAGDIYKVAESIVKKS